MKKPLDPVSGLHHVTVFALDAQKNIDFYAGVLGLRLVKKTINFDGPDVYHLYFGDNLGNPGTIITFFPYAGLVRGRKGKGQLTVTSFAIPIASIDYWLGRLKRFNVNHQPPQERMNGEVFIYLEDWDGTGLELVAHSHSVGMGHPSGPVPSEHQIRGFFGVTLEEDGYERTAAFLSAHLNYHLIAEQGNRFRFAPAHRSREFVDVLCAPEALRGLSGSGIVHHLAFAIKDDASQVALREQLTNTGLEVTPVLDRKYFHSIYFKEPGGVLFEVATSDLGFTVDEQPDELGMHLQLPDWQEPKRSKIEQILKPVFVNLAHFQD